MGIFPMSLVAWIYTAGFGVLAFFGLCGFLYLADRKRTKAAFGILSIISLIAIVVAWFTGFTFHLNTSAPLPDDRVLYTFLISLARPIPLIQLIWSPCASEMARFCGATHWMMSARWRTISCASPVMTSAYISCGA
jgi:hypothetical protein